VSRSCARRGGQRARAGRLPPRPPSASRRGAVRPRGTSLQPARRPPGSKLAERRRLRDDGDAHVPRSSTATATRHAGSTRRRLAAVDVDAPQGGTGQRPGTLRPLAAAADEWRKRSCPYETALALSRPVRSESAADAGKPAPIRPTPRDRGRPASCGARGSRPPARAARDDSGRTRRWRESSGHGAGGEACATPSRRAAVPPRRTGSPPRLRSGKDAAAQRAVATAQRLGLLRDA
jgi:hypothetical protein